MKNTHTAKSTATFISSLSLLSVSILVAAPSPCHAEEPSKASTKNDIVKFDFYGVPVDMDSMVGGLASALKAHPNAPKFRTEWSFSLGGGSGEGAVLYDRKLKTLKYYERDYDSSGVSTHLYIYSGVTDDRIQEAAADLGDKERYEQRIKERQNKPLVSAKTVFDGLLRYGSYVTGGWRYRGWDEKEPSLRG